MDYGKLAYGKVEELEARIALSGERKESGGASASFFPKVSLMAGEFPLTEISGEGSVAIILNLEIRRDGADSGGSVILLVDGKSAGINKIDASGSYMMLASVTISGSVAVSILPSAGLGCTLVSASMVAVGAGASIGRRGSDWACDYSEISDTLCVAAISRDEKILVALINGGVIGEYREFGNGHIFDIAACGGGFSLVYCDDLDNTWGVRIGAAGEEIRRVCIGRGGESVAITSYNGRHYIGLTRAKKLYTFSSAFDFSDVSERLILEVGAAVDSVKFARHTSPPILALCQGDKVFLKVPALETAGVATYNFRTSLTISAPIA